MDAQPIFVTTSGLCRAAAWSFEQQGQPWLAMTVEARLSIQGDGPMELVEPMDLVEQGGSAPDLPFVPEPVGGRSGMLTGDEWLVLYGEGEVAPVLRTRLPKLRAAARMVGEEKPTRLVHLTLAGVCLDVATMSCTVSWRGARELNHPLSEGTSLQAMVATDGGAISWPSERLAEAGLPTRGSGTVSVSRDALARAVLPFGNKTLVGRSAGTRPAQVAAEAAKAVVLRPHQGQQVTLDVTRDALRRAQRGDETSSRAMELNAEGMPGGWRRFDVLAATGFEALSAPPRYDVDLRPIGAPLDPRQLVGKRAALRIQTEAGWRYVHAVMTEVERMREAPDHRLRVRLESPLSAADHATRCRTFIDRSLASVLQTVLEGAGWHPPGALPNTRRDGEPGRRHDGGSTDAGPSLEYHFDVPAEPRWTAGAAFHAQYRESDLAFVERLLAEDGLVYRVVTDERTVRLIVAPSSPPAQDVNPSVDEPLPASVRLIAGRDAELTASSDSPHYEPGMMVDADVGGGETARCQITTITMRLECGSDPTALSCRARLGLTRPANRRARLDSPTIVGAQVGTAHVWDAASRQLRVRLPWTERGDDAPVLSGWLSLPCSCTASHAVAVGDPVLLTYLDGAPNRPVVTALLPQQAAQGSDR
jgi:Phage tail baseplate hub (GPD)